MVDENEDEIPPKMLECAMLQLIQETKPPYFTMKYWLF